MPSVYRRIRPPFRRRSYAFSTGSMNAMRMAMRRRGRRAPALRFQRAVARPGPPTRAWAIGYAPGRRQLALSRGVRALRRNVTMRRARRPIVQRRRALRSYQGARRRAMMSGMVGGSQLYLPGA